jgi:hypothetical protein
VRTYDRIRESTSHPTAARPPPQRATTPITNMGSEVIVQQSQSPHSQQQSQSPQQVQALDLISSTRMKRTTTTPTMIQTVCMSKNYTPACSTM